MRFLVKLIVYFSFLVLVTIPHNALAQSNSDWNAITTGKWMYDLNPSPFVSLYKMSYFIDDSGNKKNVSSILKEAGINIDSIPYTQIKFNKNIYLATKKNEKGNIRLFKVLKETDNLFILCSEEAPKCECKANTFIYYKPKLKLQRIQRPFSFSLKRDLLKRLDDMGIDKSGNYDNLSFCEIIEEL